MSIPQQPSTFPRIQEAAQLLLQGWLSSCLRGGKLSRNTIAVGIVVLDHLKSKGLVAPDEVMSPGGEIVGARGRLHQTLRAYGVAQPQKYLKEVTTRQAHPDGRRLFEAFEYGAFFSTVIEEERARILLDLIQVLVKEIDIWFDRQNLKIGFERHHAPTEWVRKILEAARSKSGGVVEQHLVGAKLQKRHRDVAVPNFPGHAADVQTGRAGDFIIAGTVYHVTVAPSRAVVQKCGENITSGLYPVILVPSELVVKTRSFAEFAGLERVISVIAIEDFIALNIIEMAVDDRSKFLEVLRQIIQIYNDRIEEVETDMSLKIEPQ